MADSATRALEREQDPEARAAVLAARLRAGEECACGGYPALRETVVQDDAGGRLTAVDPLAHCPDCAGLSLLERVRLAAYAGDEAAQQILGGECVLAAEHETPGGVLISPPVTGRRRGDPRYAEACPGCHPSASLAAWVGILDGWGQPVLVRAAVAAAMACWDAWGSDDQAGIEAGDDTTSRADPRRAIEAAEAWLACPCEAHAAAWVAAWERLGGSVAAGEPGSWTFCPVPPGAVDYLTNEGAIRRAARLCGEAPVRAAVQRALVAWALGGAA